ncbi:MAG: hypothetical protein JNN32_12020 [Flavobacteriales bacterium]|nr:hypothetical protein [Flavobacteriales bacterium]
MTRLISFSVVLLAGVLGFFLARLIANACVSWFRLGYSDGASGLLQGYAGVVGALVGLVIGFITARMVAAFCGPGFLNEAAGALGMVLLIAGLVALRLRLHADIAPTIGGQELNLEVEFRFPNTRSAKQPPTAHGDAWEMVLGSYSGELRRKAKQGSILTEHARQENGQWIVPAEVHLFTERGRREVMIGQASDPNAARFVLPVPRRPGRKFERWSDWLPERQANGRSSLPAGMSCRFRVQRIPKSPR